MIEKFTKNTKYLVFFKTSQLLKERAHKPETWFLFCSNYPFKYVVIQTCSDFPLKLWKRSKTLGKFSEIANIDRTHLDRITTCIDKPIALACSHTISRQEWAWKTASINPCQKLTLLGSGLTRFMKATRRIIAETNLLQESTAKTLDHHIPQ